MGPLATTDRLIDPSVLRRRRLKSSARAAVVVLMAVVLCYLLYVWVRPSVSRATIRTSVVDRGTVEATIPATGVILPAHEQVITSPIDTRVIAVLRRAGDKLSPGDQILRLDTSEARLALERTKDNLTVKENERAQVELELNTERNDLVSRLEIKKLQKELSASKVEQLRKLATMGGASGDQVRQAELEERVAAIELEQLQVSFRNRETVTQSKLANLDTQIALLRKEQTEMRRQLMAASTRVDRAGVLTWVLEQEGVAVRKSDPIARIADLASFRISGNASDAHVGALLTGLPARVVVNDNVLSGTVTSVNPAIQAGVISFEVALTDPKDPRLHPNMKADVYVVAARRDSVVRVHRGQISDLSFRPFLFVQRGGTAVRTAVQFGLIGYDYVEVTDGLRLGDTVLVSDMREYEHLEEVHID